MNVIRTDTPFLRITSPLNEPHSLERQIGFRHILIRSFLFVTTVYGESRSYMPYIQRFKSVDLVLYFFSFAGAWQDTVSVSGVETKSTLRGLLPTTTYQIRVRADNAFGSSDYSAVVEFTTSQERKFTRQTTSSGCWMPFVAVMIENTNLSENERNEEEKMGS